MDSTLARPNVGEARLLKWSDGNKIAATLGGTVLLGVALDAWGPGGRVLPIAFALGVAISLSMAGIAARRRLGNLMGGFRFAGNTLLALAAASAVGTLVVQGKSIETYQQTYGGWAGLLISLGVRDIAHSCWFSGLVALVVAGLVISMVQRWPVKAATAGFYASHVGLILTLAGAGASSLLAVRGTVDLRIGSPAADAVAVRRDGQPTGQAQPLGFALELNRFEVQRYDAEHRLAIYEKRPTGEFALKASFEAVPGSRHRLPGGGRFTVKAAYPDFVVRGRADPSPGGVPALHVVLDGKQGWLYPAQARVDSADGAIAILFGDELPLNGVAPTTILVQLQEREAVVIDATGARTVPLSRGLALAGGRVRLDELLPEAKLVPEYATASDKPANPAVVIDVHAVPGHDDGEVPLVASEHAGFDLPNGAVLTFERTEQDVRAFRSEVTVRGPDGVEQRSIAVNDPLQIAGWTFYQVNFDPKDPTYSGLEAVKDPGAPIVFLGFALGGLGVIYTTIAQQRRGRRTTG